MIGQQLLELLKRDTRNATEISNASGVHAVNVRKMRLGSKPVDTLPLDTAERMAKALGAEIVLRKGKKIPK